MFMRSGYSAHTRSTRPVPGEATASGTQDHHRASHVVPRGTKLAGALGTQARLDRLALQLIRGHAVELDDIAYGSAVAVDAPLAFDQHALLQHGHADGTGLVDRAVHAGDLRRGRRVTVGAIERLNGRDDRGSE